MGFFQMDPMQVLSFLVALLATLTFHEASHALVAYYLGDPTAKMEGRLSLNPVNHLDPMGTMIFLITWTVGWGKPVPVNPRNFKHPVRDSALVALAGPVSNLAFAFVIALLWKYLGTYMWAPLLLFVQTLFHMNVFLAIFNLFPFPPLDGSKILGLIIPKRWYGIYANYLESGVKYLVVIMLVDVFILGNIFGFSIFSNVMQFLHDRVSTILLLGT
ncbi:MAG: site-2 protease family protein [Candidatus Peregrinibacteria bacterium]|nr:site-2 protease family protein [Candidatus Peregrinibacteria bacterium]